MSLGKELVLIVIGVGNGYAESAQGSLSRTSSTSSYTYGITNLMNQMPRSFVLCVNKVTLALKFYTDIHNKQDAMGKRLK